MREWREEWPDESEAIIYCTPQDAVKNMNLGAGIDPTAVSYFKDTFILEHFSRQYCSQLF